MDMHKAMYILSPYVAVLKYLTGLLTELHIERWMISDECYDKKNSQNYFTGLIRMLFVCIPQHSF